MSYICYMKYLDLTKYHQPYSDDTKLILVDINALMVRLRLDSPEYFIDITTKNSNSISQIDSSINYIQRNSLNEGCFEAPLLTVENGKIGVIDGRHRIAASKKIGYSHIYVEIPNQYAINLLDLI